MRLPQTARGQAKWQEQVARERERLRQEAAAKDRDYGGRTLNPESMRKAIQQSLTQIEGVAVGVLVPPRPLPSKPDYGFVVVAVRGSDWARAQVLVVVTDKHGNCQVHPPDTWIDTRTAPVGEILDYETELAAFHVALGEVVRIAEERVDEVTGNQGVPGGSPDGPAADPYEALRRLGELRDEGILTDEEFAGKKAELLARL